MATGNVEMREVETFLKNKGISISCNNAWLRSCVECFRTQFSNYRIKEMLDFVFEQWLLADLREVCSSSLPKECSTSEKFTITGKHAVQLNFCLDVSTSSYLQLQKIRRPGFGDNLCIESERDHGEQPYAQKSIGRRSFKLEISDGQLTVIGFEDKPIPCLKNPVPGEKALLKGPIECRKGILMLTDKNIEIFGGEVDTILIPNAVENVLARLLGQPEDPNPYRQHIESIPGGEGQMLSDCLEEDNEALIMLAESMDMSEMSNPPQTPLANSNVEYSSLSNRTIVAHRLEFDDDDFDLIAAQTASLAEAEASRKRHKKSLNDNLKKEPDPLRTTTLLPDRAKQLTKSAATKTECTSSPGNVEYVDMNDPKRLKKELEESYGSGTPYYNAQTTSHLLGGQSQSIGSVYSNKESKQTTSSSYNLPLNKLEEIVTVKQEIGSSLFSKNSLSEKSNSNELPNSNSPHSSSSLQETDTSYLRQDKQIRVSQQMNDSMGESAFGLSEETEDLSDPELELIYDNSETFHQPYPPRKYPALRVVRGQVIRLSEKLTLKNDQWCLSAVIAAKGLEIEMTFASDVLDKIFGVTAAELVARKNDLKTNPAAKEQMNKLLRDSQLRIKNLNCEMVIRFPSAIAKPVIIDVMQK